MKVKINKYDHFGRGIGKIDKKIVFVKQGLPNEVLDITITNSKKNYLEAKINKIIQESSNRIEPICPLFGKCGGCDFLHIYYDEEKKFKIEKGRELLGKIDKYYETQQLNYRNKVTLHVKGNEIGFYKEKTNEIVKLDYCYLLNDKINKVIRDLNSINIANYHIKKIIVKCNLDKLLLNIDNEVDNYFLDYFKYVDTIISNGKVVKGSGFIEEIIDNKKFVITSEAFFQVNKEGLENINKIIQEFIKDKKIDKVLDLYSGTSLWGILVSDYVNNVVSIEINKEACQNAKQNIKNNNINNIKVINGDVKDYIDEFSDIDLVIIDPPRSGLDKKTRDYLKVINSKYIIYISCDMQTLKRDLQELIEKYDVQSINLVDMFKRTYHCESICLLERK